MIGSVFSSGGSVLRCRIIPTAGSRSKAHAWYRVAWAAAAIPNCSRRPTCGAFGDEANALHAIGHTPAAIRTHTIIADFGYTTARGESRGREWSRFYGSA